MLSTQARPPGTVRGLDVLLAIGAIGGMAVLIVTAIHSTPAVPLALQALLTTVALVLLALVPSGCSIPQTCPSSRAAARS